MTAAPPGTDDGAVSAFPPPLWAAPPARPRIHPAPPPRGPVPPRVAESPQVSGPPQVESAPPVPAAAGNRFTELFAEDEPGPVAGPLPEPAAVTVRVADGPTDEPEPPPVWLGVTRGVASVLGVICVAAAFGPARDAGFDGRLWWADLSPLPSRFAPGLLGFAGAGLLGFAAVGCLPGMLRWGVLVGASAVAGLAGRSAFGTFGEDPAAAGLAAHLAVCLGVVAAAAWLAPARVTGGATAGLGGVLAGVAACGLGFPLAGGALADLPEDRTPAALASAVGTWWATPVAPAEP